MATLTEPTVSLSPGYALTAQEITDMYQKLTITQGAAQTLQSWGTTGQWTYVDGSTVAAGEDPSCYDLECQINNIQKVLDNRSTILLI